MTDLPIVTISPTPEGCVAVCSCSWTFRAPSRPTVDLEANQHRAKCATKGRR